MRRLRLFTVRYDDGSTLTTNMARGVTDDQIREYYIGQSFTYEDLFEREHTRTGISVDIHSDFLTCPHCYAEFTNENDVAVEVKDGKCHKCGKLVND